MTLDRTRFPIGQFAPPKEVTQQMLKEWIAEIAAFPAQLKQEVMHLTDTQLDTPYRPGGWTIRQVVHHCADSHANSLIRFKLALTEDNPTIRPYHEDRWAELPDSREFPIDGSIKILEGLHQRWAALLGQLTPTELQRTFIHPEHGRVFRLDENIGLYAWHCKHHLAHITGIKGEMGWE